MWGLDSALKERQQSLALLQSVRQKLLDADAEDSAT